MHGGASFGTEGAGCQAARATSRLILRPTVWATISVSRNEERHHREADGGLLPTRLLLLEYLLP